MGPGRDELDGTVLGILMKSSLYIGLLGYEFCIDFVLYQSNESDTVSLLFLAYEFCQFLKQILHVI